jgi:hypothetical protein
LKEWDRREKNNEKVVLASGSARSDYKYCLDEETRELKNRRILNVNWKIIFS